MRQIEIIQKDLCDSHEHFGALHPSVVAPNRHLASIGEISDIFTPFQNYSEISIPKTSDECSFFTFCLLSQSITKKSKLEDWI